MKIPKHMPALDELRGVAILLVISTHVASGRVAALSIYQDTVSWVSTFHVPLWLSTIASDGGHGVQLFFVVSAFTLTLRQQRDDGGFGRYAVRRIARVGPGYWLAGIAYTLLGGLGPRLWAPDGVGASDLAVAAVFGSAWQGGAALAVVPGGWSVVCEVSFYVMLPLLLRVIDGRLWRAFSLTGLAIAVATLNYHFSKPIVGEFAAFVSPTSQAAVFLCGITAALSTTKLNVPRLPGASVALLGLAIAGVPFKPIHHMVYLQFTFVVVFAVMLNAIHPLRMLTSRALRKLGEVSYSMYLIHFVVLAPSLLLAERLFPGDDSLTFVTHFAVTSLVSFLLACVTFTVIERPAINWAASRTRRAPSPLPSPAT